MFRVFVVEDDLLVCDLLKELLEALPHVAVAECASTEDAAINWLVNNNRGWNMAVVDLALDKGSGLRVLSACRVRHPRQKMVVLSNHVDKDARRRCVNLGADATFDKAAELEGLIGYCREASRGASAESETDFLA